MYIGYISTFFFGVGYRRMIKNGGNHFRHIAGGKAVAGGFTQTLSQAFHSGRNEAINPYRSPHQIHAGNWSMNSLMV